MKYSYLPLLLSLFLLLTFGNVLKAQLETTTTTSETATTGATVITGNGNSLSYTLPADFVPLGGAPMVENDFARDEVIFWFEEALDTPGKELFKAYVADKLGGNNPQISFTRWGHYALVKVPPFKDVCDYLGEGNPFTPLSGQGEEVGLNYFLTNQSWTSLDQESENCLGFTSDEPGSVNRSSAFSNTSLQKTLGPTSNCLSSTNTVPRTGQKGARIAIIDSGVSLHSVDDLYGLQLTTDKIDPRGNFSDVVGPPAHGHGTYIANIIGALADQEQLSSRIALHSYEVLNKDLRTSTFAVVAAIEDATYNEELQKDYPLIISLSIGFIPIKCKDIIQAEEHEDRKAPLLDWDILDNSIRQASDAGIIVITSAGNRGVNLDINPQYPAAYIGHDNLVTVGALSCSFDERSVFSNYSSNHVDLFTTGDHVYSFFGGCFKDVHGTSFATPIVAAKAAMHISAQNVYNPERVLCLLRDQSKDFSPLVEDNLAIYGIVDAESTRNLCKKNPKEPSIYSTNNQAFTLSPNPSNGPLTVTLPVSADGSGSMLSIYDSNGKVVLRRESRQIKETFDISNLKPGVYWLNIQSGQSSTTKPIVKI